MAETPILDAIVEREPVIPRGPIREKFATKHVLVRMIGSIAGQTVRSFIEGTLFRAIE